MTSKNRIKELRTRNNLSQRELADKLGYQSITTIQRWENFAAVPPVNAVIRMAELFHINPDDLFIDEAAPFIECGRQIKILRKACKMSQQSLADKAGISFDRFRNIEAGLVDPESSEVIEVQRILEDENSKKEDVSDILTGYIEYMHKLNNKGSYADAPGDSEPDCASDPNYVYNYGELKTQQPDSTHDKLDTADQWRRLVLSSGAKDKSSNTVSKDLISRLASECAKLNDEGARKLLEYAQDLAGNPKYSTKNSR